MLHVKTIHQDTFALLKELTATNALDSFALAGGTALALQLGHRISIDLDFFTTNEFDSFALFEMLAETFELENSSTGVNSLTLVINRQSISIKTDFIRHNYLQLKPFIISEGIRFFSLDDIAAMKLNAIANRGAKKDFYDIHALLGRFSLLELLGFFEAKYRKMNSFAVIKSLAFFDDADMEPDPISLTDLAWEQIKADLKLKIREAL